MKLENTIYVMSEKPGLCISLFVPRHSQHTAVPYPSHYSSQTTIISIYFASGGVCNHWPPLLLPPCSGMKNPFPSTDSKVVAPACLMELTCNHFAPSCSKVVPFRIAPFRGQFDVSPVLAILPRGSARQFIPVQLPCDTLHK